MKNIIKDYLSYTSSQKRGVLVLMGIIILVIGYPYLYELFKKEEVIDFSQFDKEIAELEKKVKEFEKTTEINRTKFIKEKKSRKYNNIHYKEKKYKDNYNKNFTKKTYKKYQEYKIPIIEINTADTSILVKLKGIGSVYAMRIVKYRNMLGGFCDKSQLLDIYGLDSLLLDNIDKYITIDTSKIIQIDINNASFKEVNKHPYITYNQTKRIFNYKQKHKKNITYYEIEELLNNKKLFLKLKPYLKVEI